MSIARRPDGAWRARYIDDTGRQRSRHFVRKRDAELFLAEMTSSVARGAFVDPHAGRIKFQIYAEEWRSLQQHAPSTQDQIRRNFANHVYPAIGRIPLGSLRASHLQALVRDMSARLSPATVRVIMRYVSAVLSSATRDRLIGRNPCPDITLPRRHPAPITPLTTAQVHAIVAAISANLAPAVLLAATTGMRQGEVFGLTVDRIDFLHRQLRIDRQMRSVAGEAPDFGPLKTAASYRTVPLSSMTLEMLSNHVAVSEAGRDDLVFVNATGGPLRRSSFNHAFKKACVAAGVPYATFHDLRHYYASLLIRHGESVKVVQSRLGHAAASETLDTYSHLWPDSEDTTRAAVDMFFGSDEREAAGQSA